LSSRPAPVVDPGQPESRPTCQRGAHPAARRDDSDPVGAILGAGVLVALPGSWQLGTLAGWDVAAGVALAWTWATVWYRDPAATSWLARREAPSRAVADALLLAGLLG